MGELLPLRLSSDGLSGCEPFRAMSVSKVSSQPEPKTEQAFQGRREFVRRIKALWTRVLVRCARLQLLVDALSQETVGEPYAGNPHVRFDEGAADELKPCAWSAVVACDETFGALDPLLISALLYRLCVRRISRQGRQVRQGLVETYNVKVAED
jgi:hypothetical protein